jgi:DNA-directed RNA polymerase subunit H (RpoH/RPB5)
MTGPKHHSIAKLKFRNMQSGLPPLFEIYNTILNMLKARGFIIPIPYTAEEYVSNFCIYDESTSTLLVNRELLTLSLVHAHEREKTVRVFFLEPVGQKTGKKHLQQWLAKLGESRTRAIFIVPQGAEFTSHCVKLMDNANRDNQNVLLEYFSEEQVSVDITTCCRLFREYKLLSTIEAKQVMDSFQNKISCIAYDDRVARFFGMQHNDVIQCLRSSEPAGMYSSFRRCLYIEQLPKETKVKKKL